MPNVAIPEGLWRWAETMGLQPPFTRSPETVIVDTLKAARGSAVMGQGVGPALQLLEHYARGHGGRIDMRGLKAEGGPMVGIVEPVLPRVVAMGFMEPDPDSAGDYRWLG